MEHLFIPHIRYIGSIDKKLEALAVKDSVAEEEPTKHLGDLCSGDVKGICRPTRSISTEYQKYLR